jgi:hypothetical protein
VPLFGGRKAIPREDNGGLCQPQSCPENQQRQRNLTGRFLFFIAGIRSISAFKLHTRSFYAMNAAICTFETVAFLRGGWLSGCLDMGLALQSPDWRRRVQGTESCPMWTSAPGRVRVFPRAPDRCQPLPDDLGKELPCRHPPELKGS